MDAIGLYLAGLDEDQRRAVAHERGPLLIVAGAGSGKTRAIVARIVRLLRDGVAPERIVGITFTNRAAEEMRERVSRIVAGSRRGGGGPARAALPFAAPGLREGEAADGLPWLGTFHAFGAILLRRFGSRIGVPRGFAIYDDRDALEAVREAVRQANLDEKKFPPAMFAGIIERAKREGVPAGRAAADAGWLVGDKAEQVAKSYEEALRAAGAVDFADLIRLPVRMFRERPELLEAVREEVRHLLVDEYQDVDRAQAELARALALGADSFCAVGDEDQSIYGWRGGSAAPMLSFERDYPGATVIRLDTNYRTRAAIVAAAGDVIARNRLRREKTLRAAREGGEPPLLSSWADADGEAAAVARGVREEIRRGTSPDEVAVFYRVNAQSRAVEDALRTAEIPYVLRGALSFYDRAAVRDGVAYLKWFLNPEDPVALKRLLKAPRRGVGEAALARAREAARLAELPLSAELAKLPGLASLFALRARWLAALPARGPGEALRALLDESGYTGWLEARAREPGAAGAAAREEDVENVRELLRLADAFPGLGDDGARGLLERISLSPREAGKEEGRAVRLMTLHNAKGLEFDAVFLAGLEEGLLPHSRSADSEEEIEEERRLFYVGLTRARERAFLSFARRRFLFGTFRDSVPSRFLSEIRPGLLRWPESAPGTLPRPPRLDRFGRGAAEEPSWTGVARRIARPEGVTVTVSRGPVPGRARIALDRDPTGAERDRASGGSAQQRPRRVRHPLFGEGSVEAVDGEGTEMKVLARFPGFGLKKILVRAVKMEFLD